MILIMLTVHATAWSCAPPKIVEPGPEQEDAGRLPDFTEGSMDGSVFEPCSALVERACGPLTDGGVHACQAFAQCEAAMLLRDHHLMNRCQLGLSNPATYPSCSEATGCSELVLRCCGGVDGGPCQDLHACQRAQELAIPTVPADLQRQSCMEALGDTSSFPYCHAP